MSRPVLEAAAFLDSEFARGRPARERRDLQAVAETLLRCSYEDLGKAPKWLDGEDLHALLGTLLPRRFGVGDPLAAMVGPVVTAYLDFLVEREVVPQAYEIRAKLDGALEAFRVAVADPSLPRVSPPVQPVVHRGEKVGRNDPCPCGSGKKFKKCCFAL